MPITLKLSKQFYDTFGEQVANEFVDAINQVDATYRADLRELNESNFARSDAKQEARFAQFEQRWAQFDARMEQRYAQFEQRFASFEIGIVKLLEERIRSLYTFMLLGWGTTIAAVVGSAIAFR